MREYLKLIGGDGILRLAVFLHNSTSDGDVLIALQTFTEPIECGTKGLSTRYNQLLAFGVVEHTCEIRKVVLSHQSLPDYWFGHISYDYKNELEPLTSNHHDGIGLPNLFFFRPRYVVIHDADGWRVGYLPDYDDETSVRAWLDGLTNNEEHETKPDSPIEMKPRVSYREYCQNVARIQRHIQRGDIYEMNYCMEFFNDNAVIEPNSVYKRLTEVSPVPFGAFAKFGDKYLMCASLERYLCKRGNRLVSQPIKGTAPRSENPEQDQANRKRLANSLKERAENTMIVDLVRNDLSRVAKRGTVNVDELCGIYGYRQVYQMISTISAELADGVNWSDAIKATFPMGSMTGAPKLRAMELIEKYETSKRGLYSGAVGYIAPNGDFDFNVVIRSLLYNHTNHYLSYMVGSAITSMSDADEEYRECLLKGKAIVQVLGGK